MGNITDSIINSLLDINTASYASDTALTQAGQATMAQNQEAIAPYTLGVNDTKENKKRTRREIYTKWQAMASFAPIAEGLSIHVTASLGGDAVTGQLVYITPSKEVRDNKNTENGKVIYDRLMERIKPLEKILNENITKIATDGITYGDAYVRIYGENKKGIKAVVCNENTFPPLVQAYEQASIKTVAFHVLDSKSWQKTVSKFNTVQMARLKMPRIVNVPQNSPLDGNLMGKVMQEDNIENCPIYPAEIGGSFLYQLEDLYDDVMISLSCMTSQQIADAVNQMFLTIDFSGMTPAQRKGYTQGLTNMLSSHEKFIENALSGGKALFSTKFHVLPTTSEKQVLNPIGDIKGQRTGEINIEKFMVSVRLLMGGLGLDPSMVGWADMLSGGLGDGASFHTSAQIQRRSGLIRQATKQILDDIIAIDWGYRFNEVFDENHLPWNVEFYSDQSASMTEQISNQQNRMNAMLLKTQVIAQMKELNLDEDITARLLERDCGMDYDEALAIAKDIVKQRQANTE